MTDKQLPVPEWFEPRKILAQYVAGQGTEEIAKELSVSRRQLIYALTTKAPESWKEVVTIRAILRAEEAEDEIDNAKDMLALNKAREKLKSAQWNLEKVCRPIYGQDVPVVSVRPVAIQINLRRNSPAVEVGSGD